ncbi:hypothetical protein ACHAXR_013533 [Thalassiosira sp. AJA248-18]
MTETSDDDRRPTRKREKSHLALLAEANRKAAEEANIDIFIDEENEGEEAGGDEGSPESNRKVKPVVHSRSHWYNKEDQNEFQTVDGCEKLFGRRYWDHRRCIHYKAMAVLRKAEKSLVSEQDDQQVVRLDYDFNSRYQKYSQVPYHADMLPHYEYFADGIQQHSDLHELTIVNYNLPPSPWLADTIVPVLETNSKMTTLELSNCSLSANDSAALTNFLAGNRTICSLNISRNDIESVDTVKSLAKAIKKHPVLVHVNLAYCSLAGGNSDALNKVLLACKQCDSLEIGHSDFDSAGVAIVAKFLAKKIAITSFSFVGASIGKENKKLLTEAITKNKTIEKLCLRSNNLRLPAILRNTKKITKSLARITHLDLSFNSFPAEGAKVMAKFLQQADSCLVTLIMSKNNMTTKGASVLLPSLKDNATLQNLDLSRNWLNDAVAPVVIDVLKNNSTLLSLDLSGNNSLKTRSGGGYRYVQGTGYVRKETTYRGIAEVVRCALFDTTSLETIANSNHTCAVKMSGMNKGDVHEETIRKINALAVSDGKKIRYKTVLAINDVKTKDLYDPCSFNDVPLELMPHLLEMVQQECSAKAELKQGHDRGYWKYNREIRKREYIPDPTLRRLYEIIMSWQSLPLLFGRGAGELKTKKEEAKESKPKRRKRKRKFGDEEDDDDEPFIPKGARKTARWEINSETGHYERIPPPVY